MTDLTPPQFTNMTIEQAKEAFIEWSGEWKFRDKVADSVKSVKAMSTVQQIEKFAWNVVLSGENMKVI